MVRDLVVASTLCEVWLLPLHFPVSANLAVTDQTHVCTGPGKKLALISSYDRLKQRLPHLLCPDLLATPTANMCQAS